MLARNPVASCRILDEQQWGGAAESSPSCPSASSFWVLSERGPHKPHRRLCPERGEGELVPLLFEFFVLD